MKHLIANSITSDFLTSKGGLDIGYKIEYLLKEDPSEQIEISFAGVLNVAPSFVNGAFLYLIDQYGETYFRNHVKVVHASPDVARIVGDAVRSYINRGNKEKSSSLDD